MNRGSVQAEMGIDMVAELEPESESQSVQEGQDQNDVTTMSGASALGEESGADTVVVALALENFPEEILSVIWKLLPTSDLLSTRLACKRWATLISLPRLILGMDDDDEIHLQLLARAIFRKIDTFIVQYCEMTELPIHVDTKEVIPSYVRCLEIRGRFNFPQGVQAVMDQYCNQIQEFVVKNCALAMIDGDPDAVNRWEFQNLKHLKIDLIPSPSGCWSTHFMSKIFESHMKTLEELFRKDYPKLERVSAMFQATNKWEHSHYNNTLLPSCLAEFGDFLRRNGTNKIKKLEVREIVSGKQILGRLKNGLVHAVKLVSCTIIMEALEGYGVPPFDDEDYGTASDKLNRFEAWVKSIPEDDLEYIAYAFQYTSNYLGVGVQEPKPKPVRGGALTSGAVPAAFGAPSPDRVLVDLKIILRPIYSNRSLMFAL